MTTTTADIDRHDSGESLFNKMVSMASELSFVFEVTQMGVIIRVPVQLVTTGLNEQNLMVQVPSPGSLLLSIFLTHEEVETRSASEAAMMIKREILDLKESISAQQEHDQDTD